MAEKRTSGVSGWFSVVGGICAAAISVPAMVGAQEAAEIPVESGASVSAAVLDDVLMFVTDKATADAAAPVAEELLRRNVGRAGGELLSEYDRALLAVTSCYGSAALQNALGKLYTPDSQYDALLAPYEPVLQELAQILDDMSTYLERVQDKASADAAAEMATNVPAYMASLSEKVARLPLQENGELQRALNRRYQVCIRPCAARLLRAWGRVAAADVQMFGSSRLLAAMPEVNAALENMDMAADPALIAELTLTAERMEPLLENWLKVAAGVKDRASADAAAERLSAIAEQIRMLSINRMGRGYEKDLTNISPRLQMLMMATDRISHRFESTEPEPFYGSEALRRATEHEE